MIGNVWGFKAFVNITEGKSVNSIWMRGAQVPTPIEFEVRNDDFKVEFYEGGGRPKEYSSDLVILENGQEVMKKTIEVNHPLTYKGLTFYQSSYGTASDPIYRFSVKNRATGETVNVMGPQGKHLSLPGGTSLIPMGYAENYQNFGPAAQVNIDAGNHQHGTPFLVFKNYPQFDERRGGDYGVTLLDVQQSYYTGLQVAKDPGVWVVWLGCLLMVLGSCGAFFLSHRRIWVTIETLEKGIGVKLGGNAHRNPISSQSLTEDVPPAIPLCLYRLSVQVTAHVASQTTRALVPSLRILCQTFQDDRIDLVVDLGARGAGFLRVRGQNVVDHIADVARHVIWETAGQQLM